MPKANAGNIDALNKRFRAGNLTDADVDRLRAAWNEAVVSKWISASSVGFLPKEWNETDRQGDA